MWSLWAFVFIAVLGAERGLAAPIFYGISGTSVDALAREDYQIGDVIYALQVVDFADFSYQLDSSNIGFTNSEGRYARNIVGNTVYVVADDYLAPGDDVVVVSLITEMLSVTINIEVLQTNFPPRFIPDEYHNFASEALVSGDLILTNVFALDFDRGDDAVFEFRLGAEVGTLISSTFSINNETGDIFLAGVLDYETLTEYNFEIVAAETKSVALHTATATVQITVTDANDNAPDISIPDQIVSVQEVVQPTGAVLFTISATDIDAESDGTTFTFTLEASDDSLMYFGMDSVTGAFTQTAVVDREGCAPAPCQYQMRAVVCDGGTSPMCSSINVTANVLDYNDHLPVITNIPLTSNVSILECELDGRLLSTVTAVDTIDTGDFAEVFFEAVGDSENHIVLNTETGELSLGYAPLDFESTDLSFSLSVIAKDFPDSDSVDDQLQSAETYEQTITVADCNDNAPVFTRTQYDYTVTENMDNLVALNTIGVTDADGTLENRGVIYRIADSGTVNWFEISTDGVVGLRLGAVVDREHADTLVDSNGNGIVTFTIEAENAATTGTLLSVQNAQIVVTIADQNDNAPVMDQMPLTGTESITIVEDAPANTLLTIVRATDADVGDNAIIVYEITSGNELGKFAVDSSHGIFSLVDMIDIENEPSSYTITITARNPSSTPVSDSDDITLTIRVEGSNDHAPQFLMDRYDSTVSEYNSLLNSSTDPIIVATVTADDDDTDDVIEYSITGGNEDDLFEIPDSMVGNVVLKSPMLVDFETTTSYALVITATDLVLPASDRKTDTTYLYITVQDENDNVPMFSMDTYTGHVDEGQTTGTIVVLTVPISASDVDNLNGMETLMFEINAGMPFPNPFLPFVISADGNTLTTTTLIDREVDGDVFTFELRVMDSAGNRDTATVTIDIEDINDNDPIIQESSDELDITLAENHEVDTVIRTITATDADLGANAEFYFSMTGGSQYFAIDHETGEVTLIASLQPLEPPHEFVLTAIARDTGGRTSTVEWTVELTYTNDHPPIFNPTMYSGSVAECATDGTDITPVVTLTATDDDGNAMVSYYIEDSQTGNLFRLDHRMDTADLLAAGNGVYDRETQDTYTFTVYATDGLSETEDDSATVTITLTDCNDNHPIFTQELYDIDVPEGTSVDTTVIQVHTTDADVGENREVRFTILSVEPSYLTDVFRVDPVTGGIITNTDIDNEYTGTSSCSSFSQSSNNITLTVQATDQATQQLRLSNTTTVLIRLLDRNSEAPNFIPSSLYVFNISENVVNVEIGSVEATDECDVDTVVTYSIATGTNSDPFVIDSSTGVVTLVEELDREMDSLLVIQVEAVDDGTVPGPQTGYASIRVNVLDENDNDPEFLSDNFELTLPENIPVGSTLVSLLASDVDLAENGSISFRIISGDTSLFMLEGVDGSGSRHILTRVPLDRETLSNHVVVVVVEDGGTPQRTNSARMNLTLSDVNDNEPVWTAGHGASFNIYENETEMLLVDLDATDIDEGLNRELVYFFIDGSQDSGPFHVDRNNGSLYLAGGLDYEMIDGYTLVIVVSDRRGEADDDGQTPLTNSTTVTINILDINDNLPYFNRCPHMYQVLETLEVGSVVGEGIRDTIEDEDSLEIRTPFYYYIDSLEDVECIEAFCIDVNTGVISLNSEIDYEIKSTYTFYVTVSDRPNLTPEEVYQSPTVDLCNRVATEKNNITKVDVMLVDVNDQQPVFVPESLLAAVAEEAEFDTTVTVLQALDLDENSTYSTVYYEIIAVDPPYLVDRDTGEVTTADTFAGRSGEVDRFTVVAYDNQGNEPSFTSTAVLTIRVFRECQQIVAVADQPQEQAKLCRSLLEQAIANETGHIIYVTKVRVHQDAETNTVDTTKSDMIFYALDHTTGELVQPQEIISQLERALDLQDDPITSFVQTCMISNFRQFCSDAAPGTSTSEITAAVGIAMGLLAAVILALLICLIVVCAMERRKARKLKLRKNRSFDHSAQLASNPIWMPPYEHWEQESSTTANQSALDKDNPLYESQELTIEMFKDDNEDLLSIASSQHFVNPPRLSGGEDDYDPLADALGITGGGGEGGPDDSKVSLI